MADDDSDFKKGFFPHIAEHVSLLRGFLEALSIMTHRQGYMNMFEVSLLACPDGPKEEALQKLIGVSVSGLVPLEKLSGDIGRKINELTRKHFLGGNPHNAALYIEDLVWHAAEYIDWLDFFTDSCVIEKANLTLAGRDIGSAYCFTLNGQKLVVLVIWEVLVEEIRGLEEAHAKRIESDMVDELRLEYKRSDFGKIVRGKYRGSP